MWDFKNTTLINIYPSLLAINTDLWSIYQFNPWEFFECYLVFLSDVLSILDKHIVSSFQIFRLSLQQHQIVLALLQLSHIWRLWRPDVMTGAAVSEQPEHVWTAWCLVASELLLKTIWNSWVVHWTLLSALLFKVSTSNTVVSDFSLPSPTWELLPSCHCPIYLLMWSNVWKY